MQQLEPPLAHSLDHLIHALQPKHILLQALDVCGYSVGKQTS